VGLWEEVSLWADLGEWVRWAKQKAVLTTASTRPALCAVEIGGQTRIVVSSVATLLTPNPRVRVKPNVRRRLHPQASEKDEKEGCTQAIMRPSFKQMGL